MKPQNQAYAVIFVRTSKNPQTPLQGALCRKKGLRTAKGPRIIRVLTGLILAVNDVL